MPVKDPCEKYKARQSQWARCRDVICGQDAVHAAGTRYLPQLVDQSTPDYLAYVSRATFYNATWRTIAGLNGMLFRKEPLIKVPDSIKEMLKDVTMSGTPIDLLLQEVGQDVLGLGRVGILVDYPSAPDASNMTRADAQVLNMRPSMQLYRAESIINWRCKQVNSSYVLSLVVLQEKHSVQVDEFTEKSEDRYRVLDLDETGNYRVRVFAIDKDGKEMQLDEDIYPMMGNNKMTYIPFIFIGPDGITSETFDPPLIDLVNLNLSHYRTNADYEHAAHFVGLPTPVVTGYQPDDKSAKLYIGSQSAWIFANENTKASYLEFTGQGLTALETALDRKEKQMAVLGARMLEPRQKGVESAETASIHRKGEESMLSAVAMSVSLGATQALKWFVAWAEQDPVDCEVEINDDFYPAPMTPEMLTALVSSWQQGAYSDQTLFDNLQKGEIISAGTTLEEEQARQNSAPPKFAAGLPGDPNLGNAGQPAIPPKKPAVVPS